MNYPVYKCHKQVEAFQIAHITAQPMGTHADTVPEQRFVSVPREDGTVELLPTASHTEYVLVDKTGEFVAVVGDDYMGRTSVHTGGYFVQYADGYQSFSPQEAFEEGYTLNEMRRTLHVKMGNTNWAPTIEDMQGVMDLFMSVQDGPTGAVIVTNPWITATVEETLVTEDAEIVVVNLRNKKETLTALQKRDGEILWHATHVWPEGHALVDNLRLSLDGPEIHVTNRKKDAHKARGRSVNRVVLHGGLKYNDIDLDLASAIGCSILTHEYKFNKRVLWEEVE
jgi:hypothetical protein